MAQKQKIYIPTFISSIDYKPARVLPHVYFWNGMRETDTFYVQSYSDGTKTAVTASAFEQFPYFDNYNVTAGNTFPSTGSLSLLFNNEVSQYGTTPTNSLYSEYWSSYVDLLYNPRTRLVDCSAIIPLADYFKMELNDIVEWRGNYYHLRAINDYNLSNGECSLQLLGPVLFDVISAIEGGTCTLDFVSVPTNTTTTTTTTSAPTTTTTSTTTTSTTTTAAPTTTTTSTTTTAGPTTTTTTATPSIYYVIEGGELSGGVATYTTPTGTPITQSLAANERIFVGARVGSVNITGTGSQIFGSSNTPYGTVFTPSSTATSFTVYNNAPAATNSDKVVFYVAKNGTSLTYAWLPATSGTDSVTVCASYTASFQVVTTSQTTTVNNGAC